jgi:hypothetical protein
VEEPECSGAREEGRTRPDEQFVGELTARGQEDRRHGSVAQDGGPRQSARWISKHAA